MFTGTYTAIVTPFKNGEVDETALNRLIQLQIKGGVDGIVPVGTTGESPTVDYEEHIRHHRTLAVKFAARQNQSARRHRRELDERGDLSDATGRGCRRGRFAPGRAVLQQAVAGRVVPAFPRHRARDETAHRALQHSRAAAALKSASRRSGGWRAECKNIIGIKEAGGSCRPGVGSCARRSVRNLRFCPATIR